jgi:hypothetical protein
LMYNEEGRGWRRFRVRRVSRTLSNCLGGRLGGRWEGVVGGGYELGWCLVVVVVVVVVVWEWLW